MSLYVACCTDFNIPLPHSLGLKLHCSLQPCLRILIWGSPLNNLSTPHDYFLHNFQKNLCFHNFKAKRLKTKMVMLNFSEFVLNAITIQLVCKVNGCHPVVFSLLHLWKDAINQLLFFILYRVLAGPLKCILRDHPKIAESRGSASLKPDKIPIASHKLLKF